MQIEKYSDRLKTLIQSAQTLALRGGHQQLTPLHVLKALLEDEDRLAANLIEAAGGSAKQIALEVDIELGKLPKVEGAAPARCTWHRRPRACSTRPSSWRRRPAIPLSPSSTCFWQLRWRVAPMPPEDH